MHLPQIIYELRSRIPGNGPRVPRTALDGLALDAGADPTAIWLPAQCYGGPFVGRSPVACSEDAEIEKHFDALELLWVSHKAGYGAGFRGEERLAGWRWENGSLDRRCSPEFLGGTLRRARARNALAPGGRPEAADGSRESVAAAIAICTATAVRVTDAEATAELATALAAAFAAENITLTEVEAAILAVVGHRWWTTSDVAGFTDGNVAALQAVIDGALMTARDAALQAVRQTPLDELSMH